MCKKCHKGIASGMLTHLMGRSHRQRFVDQMFKNRPWPFPEVDLSASQLLQLCAKYSENNDDLERRINTRRSDEVPKDLYKIHNCLKLDL